MSLKNVNSYLIVYLISNLPRLDGFTYICNTFSLLNLHYESKTNTKQFERFINHVDPSMFLDTVDIIIYMVEFIR